MRTSKTILIIEDAEEMCWALDSIFEKEGYNVLAITRGKQAMQEIENQNIDLIISDYKLPDMTAKKILDFCRVNNLNHKTIIISAYGTPQIRKELLKLGAIAVFDKPFKIKRLIKTVNKVLET